MWPPWAFCPLSNDRGAPQRSQAILGRFRFAACRSPVPNPSVNRPSTAESCPRASALRPRVPSRRARLVADGVPTTALPDDVRTQAPVGNAPPLHWRCQVRPAASGVRREREAILEHTTRRCWSCSGRLRRRPCGSPMSVRRRNTAPPPVPRSRTGSAATPWPDLRSPAPDAAVADHRRCFPA